MENIPSWETNNSSYSQEFTPTVWNPQVYYRVHKCQPRSLFWTRWIQSTPFLPTFARLVLMLSSHLYLLLARASGFFPSRFPTKILYAFHFCIQCFQSWKFRWGRCINAEWDYFEGDEGKYKFWLVIKLRQRNSGNFLVAPRIFHVSHTLSALVCSPKYLVRSTHLRICLLVVNAGIDAFLQSR